MLKFATAQVMSKVLIPQNVGRREMQRIAHRHHFDYEVRPGFLYVRSRAISSRCNDNFDEFPAEELEKAYATFKGKPVFVNHVNHDHKRARGVIIDAALHKDANRDGSKDHWVEVLMEVDALRFPKLAQEILNGNIARTSMGCDVAFSVCSACGNKATTPAEYCTHIPGAKGQRIYRHVGSGKKVGELIRETCYGLKFFENSLLVEPPADPTAHFLGVDASGLDKTASKTEVAPSSPVRVQQKVFGSRSTLTDMFAQGGAQMDPKTASLTAEAAPAHANPGDHPWFKQVPLSHEHIISYWEHSTPEEKAQGARWYPDAHHVAKSIAKLNPDITDDREAAHKGAGVLSAYSPQQGWWANQHNAARSFLNKKAIGKGEGIMVMSSHATAAQKILDGEDHQKALKGPKTQDFAHLIEHGGNDEKGNPSHRVVVDRHALSVAAGRRLNADDVKGFPSGNRHYYEHAAQQYRTAAAVLSDREGRTIPPHEVQAVTWLTRQRLNAEGDDSPGQKGRNTVQRNQRKTWQDLSQEHTPDLHETDPPNSHVSKKTLTQLFAEAAVVPPFSGDPKLAVNQEGGEMPAFPWDKVPKINLPMTQKGWDDPRRQKMYDAKGERDLQGPAPAGPYQSLIDKLPDHAEQELSNPHGMGAADAGRSNKPRDNYPGDKREQWARSRWDNVKWPNWTDHNGRPSTPQEQLASKRNIRKRWSQTWKKPLACEHDSCPPWAHGGDAMTLSPERQQEADNHAKAFDFFMNTGEEEPKKESSRKHAYGETKAPQDVDTLRDDACPVCGDRDTFEGANCQVCGYVAPPKMFQDPDLELARQMDLRKDIAEFNGQPGQPVDPNSLDPNGNPISPDAGDPNAQPGSLPGEVQAEVQPGGDVVDPNALGSDGQPVLDETGNPVDPAMLGPDGMPVQPQQMLGPNGEPLGPQDLPPDAMTSDGKPFTPGPNAPRGPGGPEGPEEPGMLDPEELNEDGQVPDPGAGGGVPGTPEDGVPDLMCPACGFTADASQPVSVDMDTANFPDAGMATPDAVAAGDVCPNCQGGLLVSLAEEQGQVPAPVPV